VAEVGEGQLETGRSIEAIPEDEEIRVDELLWAGKSPEVFWQKEVAEMVEHKLVESISSGTF
jgi:hypothetical protein